MQELVVSGAPDFVIRIGLVELFHRGHVEVKCGEEKLRKVTFHNRSLSGLLSNMKTIIEPGNPKFERLESSRAGSEHIFRFSNATTKYIFRFSFPSDLSQYSLKNIDLFILKDLQKILKK